MGSRKVRTPHYFNSRLYLGGFVIMKNYYKSYIIPCEYLEKRIEASLPLHKAELGSIPYYTSLIFIEVGYLIISIYNQTNSFLSAILPKCVALLFSLCYIRLTQTPFGSDLNYKINYNVKPQKYISAKRFNKLIYKILNHFSKYYYNLISPSQKKPCIIV